MSELQELTVMLGLVPRICRHLVRDSFVTVVDPRDKPEDDGELVFEVSYD
jgi:hypothetical protein